MQYPLSDPRNEGKSKDFVTVLHSLGSLALTKTWTQDEIRGTDKTRNFRHRQAPVGNVFDLSRLLTEIEKNPQEGVIRGAYSGPDKVVERRLVNFHDAPHHWICLDVDKWPLPQGLTLEDPAACVDAFISCELPDEFQAVTHHWQLSSSAGKPGSEGLLNAHVWFWLSEPRSSQDLKRWARILKLPVDKTLFNPVQLHYTAAPVFEDGTSDPVKARSGLSRGLLGDEVGLAMPEQGDEQEVALVGRQDMLDPRTKPGLVGAFCRVFSPSDVVDMDLCEGDFEWQDGSDVRINWLSSRSGAAGGVCVTDDRQHLFCSHNDDPHENRAVNTFDFVRGHRFGHLDEQCPPSTPVNELPSYKAMLGWVRSLPEMQDEVAAIEEGQRAERSAQSAFGDIFDEPSEDRDAVVQKALAAIGDCQTCTELEQLSAARISPLDWSDPERERMAAAVKARYEALSAVKLPLDVARRMVRPPPGAANGAPEWLSEWVYVLESNRFFDTVNKTSLDRNAFDALHTDKMPLRQGSQLREPASELAIHRWGVRCVDMPLYAPGFPAVFSHSGRNYVNLYDERSVPVAKDEGEAGAAAVRMLNLHLKRMFPDDRERELLLSWMADRVREPGKKARWAPYISGLPGVGKSFIGDVMQAVLGPDNVKRVSGTTLMSDFTGWAAGRCLTIIEEVRQAGHRYDVAEKLKAPITNDRIDLHRKGKDPVEIPNPTSYLVLSNYADGIPVNETDRRYFFLASAIGHDEVQSLDKEGYFRTLFDTCLACPGAIRKWLLESVTMHPEYDRGGRAPWTAAKDVAVEMNRSDARVVLEEALRGRSAVTVGWASELVRRATGEVLRTRAVTANLVELGYQFVGRVKRRGNLRDQRIWALGPVAQQGVEAAAQAAEWVNDHKVDGDSWPAD